MFPLPGTFIMKAKVVSLYGETIEVGRSAGINVRNNINFLYENAKIQAVFGHFDHISGSEDAWQRFYSDSRQLIEDVGDDIIVEIIDYIFAYNRNLNREGKPQKRYKYINVKGRRYLQEFKKKGNKYVFSQRFPVKGVRGETKKRVRNAEEL